MAVYNNFVKKEVLEKVNPNNLRALEDFRLELISSGKSQGTIKQYVNDLKIFFCWVYEYMGNCDICELKKKQLRNFILYLQEKNLSSNRINRIKSCISSLLTYLEDDEDYDLEMNYMSKVKSVQFESRRDIIFLSTEEVLAVRKRLMKDKKYQILLLWDILTMTGIRHNEVFQIKKDWIVEGNRYTTHKVIGKRKKQFYVCLHDEIFESYKLYMEQRGEDEYEELWINYKGEPCSYDALYTWILQCRQILSEEMDQPIKEFNLHSMRHFFIDGMIKGYHPLCKRYGRNFSLTEVQAMVSHQSSETTNSYCNNSEEEVISKAFGW